MNDLQHYRDFLKPRGLGWVIGTLRVVVAAQCFGVALNGLQTETSSVSQYLVEEFGWPGEQGARLDQNVAYGMGVCGVLIMLRPCWPVLLPVTIWMAASAFVSNVPMVDASVRLARWEQSVRWVSPLVLMVLDFWPPRLKTYLGRCFVSIWLLRLALTATLIGSGALAIQQGIEGGPRLEMLSAAGVRIGVDLNDNMSRAALTSVGAVNLGLAMNILLTQSRSVLFLAVLWGLLTTFCHVLARGPAAMPEFLLRIAEGGVPLAILLYYNLSIDHPAPQIVPEKHA